MAVRHATIPTEGSVDAVGYTEWAEDHLVEDGTFPIAATIGLQAALDAKPSIASATLSVVTAAYGHAVAVVSATGVTAGSKIVGAQLQPNTDWDADDLADFSVTATPLTDQIEFTINRPGPIVGDFSISYMVG
jgi:hypothetical protein